FAMMREVLERRFKRLLAEAPRNLPSPAPAEGGALHSGVPGEGAAVLADFEPAPAAIERPRPEPEREDDAADSPWADLVLIDGGQGQLTAAREILANLGIEVPLVAIAKGPDRDAGRETFFVPDRDSFKLPPRDPVLYFVERLRDEAHRFAIGSHR